MPILKNTNGKGLQKLETFLKDMQGHKLYVGVTKSSNSRPKDGASNALIAYVHEFGIGVPERSFLRSTVLEQGQKYLAIQRDNIIPAIKGGAMTADEAYRRLGIVASNDVKLKITNGPFTALDQKTIDRKGSSKPLIDTGELRQSITYEVRNA
ncbi:MAG: hypothetical protein [Bacteriophage sp.]|nr:MAG: hypothetical protein [Bacteriophage sp.]